MLGRRAVLVGAASGLAGCGFHPLYGPLAKGGTISPEMASIYVAVMSERSGQLLRQALQQRLEGADSGVVKQYELTGGLSIAAEAIGIQQDTSSTRVRMNGTAGWTLRKLDVQQSLLTSGTGRATDGYNVNNQQYFAADLEQSAAVRRIADTVADQITLEIAAFFRKRAEAVA
jgi:LPS-assembly lipoprotein